MQRDTIRLLPGIGAIGITQIIGWGATFNLPGVLGDRIAADLNFSLTVALLGPTLMLVVLAGVSWGLAGSFERRGARPIMATGTLLAAFGLLLLAGAQERVTYLLPWIVLGVAGVGILTTAAQIAVAEIAGEHARQSIGILALFSGLASTIFWPLTHFFSTMPWVGVQYLSSLPRASSLSAYPWSGQRHHLMPWLPQTQVLCLLSQKSLLTGQRFG